jgi:nucleoside-diphosphate-sugar epimerase
MYAEQFGTPTTALRFFSVFARQQANGGSGVVTIFARAALKGEPLAIQSVDGAISRTFRRGAGDGRQRTTSGARPATASLPGTHVHRAVDVRALVEASGSASSIEERIGEAPGRDLVANIERAEAELGYQPCVELRAGLDGYVEWLRRNSA